jgi:hypothetical protein
VPIRTKIAIGADVAQFQKLNANFERYRAALKQLYGSDVLKAPHIAAASQAGGEVVKFVDLEAASKSTGVFSTAAQKASHAFASLHKGITNLVGRQVASAAGGLLPGGLRLAGLEGLGAFAHDLGEDPGALRRTDR